MRIFDFALVVNWEDRLANLAQLAEPERWTYRLAPSEVPLPILDSYVSHTFMRVSEQGKLAITDRIACFNTGLLTPSQEEIFGLFTVADRFDPNSPVGPANKKWFLKGWARAGDHAITAFSSLPALATYWSDPADLIFNPALMVQLNVDHIVRDNLTRFPVELGGKLGLDGVPGDLAGEEDVGGTGQLVDTVDTSASPLPLSTRNALEGAMKHSIRLAQRNYRIAVPQFHHGKIQLLLPLYLRDSSRPDLALTLEKNGDWYRAATVLYTDWAYRHARLLTRPNSEWLGGFRSDLRIEETSGAAIPQASTR